MMKRRRIVGYPILFNVEKSPVAGLVQTVAPSILERSLAEGVDIALLINHDATKVIARTGDGSLRLSVTGLGVQAMADFDPATTVGAELAAALDAGTIAGGSFGWRPIRNRWYVAGDPVRCETRSAIVSELSVIIAPKVPRFAGTWVGELRGQVAELWGKLERDRQRLGIRSVTPADPDDRAADLVVTLPPASLATPLIRLVEDFATTEWGTVRRAAEENPAAKIIETYRPRPLASFYDVLKRWAERHGLPYRGPAWAIETIQDRIEKQRTPEPRASAKNRPTMPTEYDFELERRPAPGSACARSEHFAGAHKSYTKFVAALRAAGGRTPIGSNGEPQAWNETRGWHDDRAVDSRPPARPRGTSMLEKLTRQRQHAERIANDAEASNPRAVGPKVRRLAEQAARMKAR